MNLQQREAGSAGMLAPYEGMDQFISLVEEWWEEFGDAYTEYGPGAADFTGVRGQWADLYRKVMKLKRGMWDGEGWEYLKREQHAEILRDLISHAFLSLEMIQRESSTSSTTASLKPTVLSREVKQS